MKTEQLYEALSLIARGITRPTQVAKGIGTSYRNYRNWMVRSNRGDPAFLIEVDGEEMQFAKAISLHTKLALFELRGMLLQESIYGYDEIQTKDGQVVWAIDPVAAALSEEDREWLGYRKDALLEIDGALQPVTLKKKAPFAQQIRLLEAAFADLRPSQTITQNVNLAGQVGVGFAPKVDYSKGPPNVPPPPPMPALEAPITDAEFNEVADDDLVDMLGPEPVPATPINITIAPEINVMVPEDVGLTTSEGNTMAPETDRTIRTAPTARESSPPQTGILKPAVAFDATPPRAARTLLEQSLFDELAKARARKAGQP
jgi:hypothetical protein